MPVEINKIARRFGAKYSDKVLTLGELVDIAEEEKTNLSRMVVAEAMAREQKTYREILDQVMALFKHNLEALQVGLSWGKSFLFGTIGFELARYDGNAMIDDVFINKALTYTLATEIGNHQVGLQPCAGTGDSCPYTGLIRALKEMNYPEEKVALAAALILKVGSIFRGGKKTTGCNMEGFGAGAAGVAAALTDLRGGSPRQVAKAVVIALSPTIAVPCTPRVMVKGLCATHISGAILIGNQAANLILKTSLPVEVDVDVMIAMAARIHNEAAPLITAINLEYMAPYFGKNPKVESFVDEAVRQADAESARIIQKKARDEIKKFISLCPLTQTLGDIVVGGSSIAVGSPANMARICHEMISGEIKKIQIDLTLDLFSRRTINIPAILMGAIYGARTGDVEMYRKVMDLPEIDKIAIKINRVDIPEVQRIYIETTGKSAMLDSRNRGGGRLKIVAAKPSIQEALQAAEKLGIQVVD